MTDMDATTLLLDEVLAPLKPALVCELSKPEWQGLREYIATEPPESEIPRVRELINKRKLLSMLIEVIKKFTYELKAEEKALIKQDRKEGMRQRRAEEHRE
jgi:hypothetical protein